MQPGVIRPPVQDYLRTYRGLVTGGVRRSSALSYPLRRRLPRPENRLDLTTGESLVSPVGEPLLALFDEIWVRQSYLPVSWAPIPGPTVIDVGANVGVFSVWAARYLGAMQVVAIEPSPRILPALVANLERNCIENATVLQLAVGGVRREARLYQRGPAVLDTLFRRDNYGSRFEPIGSVRVMTLDDLFTILEIERCDLLKLDCEGAEYEVLFGASNDSLGKIQHIAAEYHVGLNEHSPDSLQRFLEDRDFAVTCFNSHDVEGGHLHASRRT
jgi:FkbM family methyltransferase